MNSKKFTLLPDLPSSVAVWASSVAVWASTLDAWLTVITPSSTATERPGSFRRLEVRLGRVDFNDLEEGEVLGEGTFGTVMSGTYRGREVAIKKARGAIGSTSIMEAFRWAHRPHIRVATLIHPSTSQQRHRSPSQPFSCLDTEAYPLTPALRRTPDNLASTAVYPSAR